MLSVRGGSGGLTGELAERSDEGERDGTKDGVALPHIGDHRAAMVDLHQARVVAGIDEGRGARLQLIADGDAVKVMVLQHLEELRWASIAQSADGLTKAEQELQLNAVVEQQQDVIPSRQARAADGGLEDAEVRLLRDRRTDSAYFGIAGQGHAQCGNRVDGLQIQIERAAGAQRGEEGAISSCGGARASEGKV